MVTNKITPEKGITSFMRNHKYFRNIYYLSAVIGIFPFFLQRSGRFSSYLLFIISTTVTLYVSFTLIILNYIFFSKPLKDKNMVTSMDVVLQACLLTTHSILYIISAATSIWRVSAVRKIVEILEEVDVLLNSRSRKEYDLQDIVCFIINFIIFSWMLYAEESFICALPYAAMITNTYLATSQFSVMTSLISNRLEEACKSLNDLRKNTKPSCHQRKVTILSDVHDKLCDASEFLESFSLLITLILIVSFIGLTAIAFFMYNHQNMQKLFDLRYLLSRDPKSFSPTDKLLWFVFTLAIVWRIAASSSQLTEKVFLFYQVILINHFNLFNAERDEFYANYSAKYTLQATILAEHPFSNLIKLLA